MRRNLLGIFIVLILFVVSVSPVSAHGDYTAELLESISYFSLKMTNSLKLSNRSANDAFPVFTDNSGSLAAKPEDDPRLNDFQVLGAQDTKEVAFKFAEVTLPLFPQDYYSGKYINAKAGANELNRMPVLTPGKYVRVIGDGFLTLSPNSGYVRPSNGYYYGSGLCWATTTLGQLIEAANSSFQADFGMPMFLIVNSAPHPDYYQTYGQANGGFGYTVLKSSTGGGQDFAFTLNPAIANIEGYSDFKARIVLTATEKHKTAFAGQALGAYVLTNKNTDPIKLKGITNAVRRLKNASQNISERF